MPTTLTRYGARAATRAMRFYPNARGYAMAARAIQYGWRNRKRIKRAAKAVYRMGKRRRTAKWGRRTMPNAKARAQAKQDIIPVATQEQFPMGSLQIKSLPWPTFGDGLRQRERNMIRFKGVKICRYFEYFRDLGGADDIGPIELHWALVQFKDPVLLTTDLQNLNDFFRSHESDTTRSQNFPTYGSSSGWDMTMNCQPINPEKYRIITHRRYLLEPRNNTTGVSGIYGKNRTPHFVKIEKYFKFNKVMNFRNQSDGVPDNNIVEVYWYNTATLAGFPADPVAKNYITSNKANTLYYGDMRK